MGGMRRVLKSRMKSARPRCQSPVGMNATHIRTTRVALFGSVDCSRATPTDLAIRFASKEKKYTGSNIFLQQILLKYTMYFA